MSKQIRAGYRQTSSCCTTLVVCAATVARRAHLWHKAITPLLTGWDERPRGERSLYKHEIIAMKECTGERVKQVVFAIRQNSTANGGIGMVKTQGGCCWYT